MQPIHVLIVDDNPIFIEAARRFFSAEPWLEVIGHALSGREALKMVTALQPDLVLMDYVMPGMNGLEATGRIKARPDAPRVVILTLHNLPEYRAQAETVQADGFVSKAEFGRDLLPLIQTLFAEADAPAPVEPPPGDNHNG